MNNLSNKTTYKISKKVKAFVILYLQTGNVAKAARDVGIARGDQVLGRPNVQALIKKLQVRPMHSGIMTLEESCEILSTVARDIWHKQFIAAHVQLAKIRGWCEPDTTQQNLTQVNIQFIDGEK